ncbi:hypothetical protein CXF32_06905 [Corynebacterium bovis]|nr:hypothetical protein CXF32_06905 [Corynebacterium bovis]RRO97334.1 hypothetical protein CXF31_06445 [Corynebacterium bovis]
MTGEACSTNASSSGSRPAMRCVSCSSRSSPILRSSWMPSSVSFTRTPRRSLTSRTRVTRPIVSSWLTALEAVGIRMDSVAAIWLIRSGPCSPRFIMIDSWAMLMRECVAWRK